MVYKTLLVIVGFAGGIIVGSSIAAFVTLLEIIPRLAQLSNSSKLIPLYEKVLITSLVLVTLSDFFNLQLNISKVFVILIGLVMGVFVGLLAAALAEVLNVIPVLVRRLEIKNYVYYVLFSLTFGKVIGSLIQWIILVK